MKQRVWNLGSIVRTHMIGLFPFQIWCRAQNAYMGQIIRERGRERRPLISEDRRSIVHACSLGMPKRLFVCKQSELWPASTCTEMQIQRGTVHWAYSSADDEYGATLSALLEAYKVLAVYVAVQRDSLRGIGRGTYVRYLTSDLDI